MNFGDRERVIMPNGSSASSSRRRARPQGGDAANAQNPFAAALSIDTLDPFDEMIRLADLKPIARPTNGAQSAPEPAPPAAPAESIDPRVDAATIRAEARQWGKEHVAEADSVATQRILEAEFEARRIVEEARAGARKAHAEALTAEPNIVEPDASAPNQSAPAQAEAEQESPAKRRRRLAGPVAIIAAVVVVIAVIVGSVVIRTYVAQPFTVESDSMEPALHQGDRLLVNKVAYKVGDPERGDVIVIDTGSVPGASDGIPDTVVKRVVALPGETVSAANGRLFIDGSPIDQPWLGDVETLPFGPVVLPPGAFYVLGDNRSDSIDSRVFGAVPDDAIIGRVEGVLWPLSDVGRV